MKITRVRVYKCPNCPYWTRLPQRNQYSEDVEICVNCLCAFEWRKVKSKLEKLL